MSFAVMEDSAMPGGNMSAMTDFREAVFRHCLFFTAYCLSETHALNPGVRGSAPESMQGYVTSAN